MSRDLAGMVRAFFQQLSDGEKGASEILSAINTWIKESGESFKAKIDSEIEASAQRMGFIRQRDLNKVLRQLKEIEAKIVALEGALNGSKSLHQSKSERRVDSKGKQSSSRKSSPQNKMVKKAVKKNSPSGKA